MFDTQKVHIEKEIPMGKHTIEMAKDSIDSLAFVHYYCLMWFAHTL